MSQHPHTFSKRTAWDLRPSEFSLSVAAAKAVRTDLLDLTLSNPTVCGFAYDSAAVLGPFADPGIVDRAMTYHPDPRGLRSAREAVVRYYADHGTIVDPDALMLTTSTSEGYSFLFRLLCDSGDEVLAAQPSYPLFDFLADLDDIKLMSYPLFYDYGWWIDFDALERRITAKTRAILVVHPNNPTGHWTHQAERRRLEELCLRHGLALVIDEVFLDYPIAGVAAQSFATGPHPALTFVLSGISKIAALPQMKVAWIAGFGPAAALKEAFARLEMIADTFLSLNVSAQLALSGWLAGRGSLQRQISARTGENLEVLMLSGLEVLHLEAGWSAVTRFRGLDGEQPEQAALNLLHQAGVIAHPGSFYGFADARIVVMSLLTPASVLRLAVDRIRTTFGA